MIYLVTNEKTLFKSGKYQVISPEDAIKLLDKENLLGADSETAGFDPYTKPLLAFQLGTTEFQIVWDCVTVPITKLKPILENPAKTFIFWNANFDLQFLYHQRIIPSNVYDGFLAEKLLWLGYPAGMHGMSLKDACLHYCGVSLDKSVRGEIIEVGLTERTILYAARDVEYEIPIYKAQQRALAEKDLLKAIELENKFIKIPPYISYCGMRLDVQKWKSKMRKDRDRLDKATTALNNWAVNYYLKHKDNGNTFCITDCILVREEKQGRMVECPKPSYKYVPIGPEKVNEDKYGKKGVYQEIRIDFPYIKIDLQGDLFSGFNTAPQCTINWSSSKQVIAFFELLGINVLTYNRKTHKETKSVEANVLKPQKNKFNIIPIYLDYKESAKVVEGYGENWLKAINPVTHRIHLRYNPIGTDTSRLSSGGGEEKLNAQNIPSDEETRACFIASNGYKWLSCDYSGQESRLLASIANDEAMINLFTNDCGDMHSLVAKMSYPKEIGNTPIPEIKSKFHDLRQKSKSIEFAISYGGDAHTICTNVGISLPEARGIYDNYMRGFKGVKVYQDYCRKEVLERGYILLNPVTRHKAFIYDYDRLRPIYEEEQKPGFWNYYYQLKRTDPDNEIIPEVEHYKERKAASQKQSINYRIQNSGAMCYKLSAIYIFNHLQKHNLLFKIKWCVAVHDENDFEVPESLIDEFGNVVLKLMEEGAKPFCTRLPLPADKTVGDFWIH